MGYYTTYCLDLNEYGEKWSKEEIKSFYEFLYKKVLENKHALWMFGFYNLNNISFEDFLEKLNVYPDEDGILDTVITPDDRVKFIYDDDKVFDNLFKEASLLFPGKIITIDGEGESVYDIYRIYYKDGDVKKVDAVIHHPPPIF